MRDVKSFEETPGSPEKGVGWKGICSRPIFVCLCLTLVTLAVFGSMRSHQFIDIDDPTYVTENPHIAHGLTGSGIIWAFTTDYAGNWHPLTWISHMLDVSLFGTSAAGPHMVNLLFHAANAVLLFLALRGLTFAHWRSAIVAALFALHPLHVESVAWVAERKDVLSTLFWMLTLLMYGRYVLSVRGRLANYLLALLFFALGLMSKSMLVTVPFVLLLLDYWPLKRFAMEDGLKRVWPLVREKIPFFVLSGIVSVVTYDVQDKGGAVVHLAHYSIGQRVSNAFIAYAEYIGKTFWPTDLAVFYPNPLHWPLARLGLCIFLVLGLTGAAIYYGRRWRFLFTGWFWFFGTLIPVIGLVQVGGQAFADRYSYVPSIGIFIVLVWGAGALAIRWRIPALAGAVVSMAVIVALSAVTLNQLRYWQNSEALFLRTGAVTRDNYEVYYGLGNYYLREGRLDEAIANYERGRQMNPSDLQVLHNLGVASFRKGNYEQAADYYQVAIRIKPDQPDNHSALGDVFIQLKKPAEAIAEYQESLRLRPDNWVVHSSLGDVFEGQRRYPEALAEFTEVLRLNPTARAECGLGEAMDALGKPAEALKHYTEALRLDPDNARTHYSMAFLMVEIGQNDAAIEQFSEAIKCQPQFAAAENNLGTLLMRLGRVDEAEKHFRAVIQYEPNHVGAHVNLASALVGQRKFEEAVAEYNEALQLAPDSLEAHLGIAVALAQLGKPDEAIAHLHEVLRLKPDLDSAKQFLEKLEAAPAH